MGRWSKEFPNENENPIFAESVGLQPLKPMTTGLGKISKIKYAKKHHIYVKSL
jgi:hypothetical protein